MSIITNEQAKELIKNWLTENHHQITEINDENANFHFEVDYPLGTMKRQRVIQPKEYPGLVVLLNGVAISSEHIDKMKDIPEDEKETFYNSIRKDLLFLPNSYELSMDDAGVAKQVQFSYEFYYDGLTKTKIYEGLLMNHRTLLYIITTFNEKFGVPIMPKSTETIGNA